MQSSRQRLHRHFEQIILLLSQSRRRGDSFWRAAAKRFQFSEVAGLCIGYSGSSATGSGIGKKLKSRLLATAKDIIDAGIKNPEIFEIMGLFEVGIGADRIGDMTANIIMPDLLAFSERVFNDVGVSCDLLVEHEDKVYSLPENPYNGAPVILVPRDILNDLPVAHGFQDIDDVVYFNEQLRARLNSLVGANWRRKRPTKAEYKRSLLDNPTIFAEFLEIYRGLTSSGYDFNNDPDGHFVWYRRTIEYVTEYPLDLTLNELPTADEVFAVVLQICHQFKQAVENNGLHTLLYRDPASQTPKHEEASQKLFFGIANAYCSANNLDLSPETNSGRGSVDFKISAGFHNRVVVETKLSSNRRLEHGFSRQLVEYQKAEQTEHSVYVVIDVGGCSPERWENFRQVVLDAKRSRSKTPEVIFVDGKRRPPASRID